MKKSFKLIGLDCANCAAKMERAASKIPGVTSVTFSFMTQKMTIDCEDESVGEILNAVEKSCKSIEPGIEIVR